MYYVVQIQTLIFTLQHPAIPSRRMSRLKIALPRFNGDILLWQPF
jgi:hypothetical protein